MAQEKIHIPFRVSPELHAKIVASAQENKRSMNMELTYHIERALYALSRKTRPVQDAERSPSDG